MPFLALFNFYAFSRWSPFPVIISSFICMLIQQSKCSSPPLVPPPPWLYPNTDHNFVPPPPPPPHVYIRLISLMGKRYPFNVISTIVTRQRNEQFNLWTKRKSNCIDIPLSCCLFLAFPNTLKVSWMLERIVSYFLEKQSCLE